MRNNCSCGVVCKLLILVGLVIVKEQRGKEHGDLSAQTEQSAQINQRI